MGNCFSSKVDAQSSFNTGFSSKNASEDGRKLIRKLSSPSVSLAIPRDGEVLQSPNLKNFSYNELKSVTRSFRADSVIGIGGFGSVYKGWIDEHTLAPAKPDAGLMVAVKKLNRDGMQGHREWLAEVNYLGQLHHPNLVRLIGYCLEDDNRMLVYEFMPRGSVENHLFRRGSYFQPLSWSIRMKVALDAARGLAFLHSDKVKVIYRDFKTSNILLDSSYTAKLSDFGLARDGPTGDKSHVSTRVMGTQGYAAPEYLATGHLTPKIDIYSFGVVLLELLFGRRAIDKNQPSGQHNLVEWARPYLSSRRRLLNVMDVRIEGQYSWNRAQKVANLALQCLSEDSKFRPTMADVVATLEEVQEPGSSQMKDERDSGSSNGAREKRNGLVNYPRPSAAFLVH